MTKFTDLNEEKYKGSILIVDIDGTLVRDGAYMIEESSLEKLRRLSGVAQVYVFSNGDRERTRRIAESAGVFYIDSPYRKPNRRVAEGLVDKGRRLIVIGDKIFTDGLLAINIGADFVPVERVRHQDDSFITKIIYGIDDFVGFFVRIMFPVLPYVVLMRPLQWVKNLLVFAPVFFAVEALAPELIQEAFFAMIIFCVTSSALYIFNDIKDLEGDRGHPVKRLRPLVTGSVKEAPAAVLAIFLIVLSFASMYFLPSLFPIISAYIIINLLYSFVLKRIVVIDIVCVAFSYVLRVIAGGVATAIYISPWIILCVFFGALFLVIGKRRAEFLHASKRKVLDSYTSPALDYMLAVSATLSLTSYGLYSVLGSKSAYAVYSTIFVAVAIFRLLNHMYTTNNEAEYPETLVFKDRIVFLTIILWAAYMFVLLYFLR